MEAVLISPDGSRFAVVGSDGGRIASVYWRHASEEQFRIIPGTERARFAAFSPEGDWIAYRQTGQEALMKVSMSGGAPVPIVPVGIQSIRDPHWGQNGTIVFTGPQGRGLFRVSDNGGQLEQLSEEQIRNPFLLPGGRIVATAVQGSGLVLLDTAWDSIMPLGRIGLKPMYVDTGHLLYVDLSGQLWAAEFDMAAGQLGAGVPIQGGVYTSRSLFARYSVSRTGTAVFGLGASDSGEEELVTVDMTGQVSPIPLSPRGLEYARWSPDGTRIVFVSRTEGVDRQIFIFDVELETTPRQLTFLGDNVNPVWSPDGESIAFGSVHEGTDFYDVFVKSVVDDLPPRHVARLPGFQSPADWPKDETLVFYGQGDVWTIDPTADSATAALYLDTEENVFDTSVDPKAEYAIYRSALTANLPGLIYARRYPESGQPELISDELATRPMWSPQADAIFYVALAGRTGRITRVRIARNPLRVLSRESLFELDGFGGRIDLHPDGDRFLVIRDVVSSGAGTDSEDAERFVLVVNWFDELRQRLGN